MPKIGLKLDCDFSENPVYLNLYENRDILDFLYNLGIRALETPIGPETDEGILWNHIMVCKEAGFIVSLHPYSERKPENPTDFSAAEDNPCRVFHEKIFKLANRAAFHQKSKSIINIHAAATDKDIGRDILMKNSIAFFKWARDWRELNAPLVEPVIELQIRPNPDEGIKRLGDSYRELLEISEESGLNVCWDFGHAFLNTRRFGDPLFPPEDFLSRVAHVHCHDVSKGDHHPLIFDTVPWRDFLNILIKAGFNETVILEVPPGNFSANNGANSLIESVQKLKSFLENYPS